MGKVKTANSSGSSRKMRPALSPEARENQMVSLAVDLVQQRLMDGSASSQETTHFLKIGSTKNKLEKEILQSQIELTKAKTKSIQSAQKIEELYTNALDAMRNYNGQGGSDD